MKHVRWWLTGCLVVAMACVPAGGGGGGGDDDDGGVETDGAGGQGGDVGAGGQDDMGETPDGGDRPDGGDPADGGGGVGGDPDPDMGGGGVGGDPDPDMGGMGGAGGMEGEPCDAEGTTERRPCGLNDRGRVSRTCVDGFWTEFGACDDPDVCVDRSEEVVPCGFNDRGEQVRTCEEGQWSPFAECDDPDECLDGGIEIVACGLNERGQRSRNCADGRWSDFGDCADPDICTDGEIEREACGFNGRGDRSRTCAAGQWPPFGACDDPDECLDGARETVACGLNARGERARTCANGRWGQLGACEDPDVCRDGARETRDCGLNGRGEQARTCQGGQFGAFGACADPDECIDGALDREACGINGNGERVRACFVGQYGDFGECQDPDGCENGAVENQACGLNGRGIQSRTCVGGIFGAFGPCDDPDDCVDFTREEEECPGVPQNRVRTCIDGQFGDFVPAICPATQCDNALDDDGDGRVDLDDPGCEDALDNDEFDVACANGVDDDGDNRVDLLDPGCVGPWDADEADPAVVPQCGNGLDDDGDGAVDLADDQCLAAGSPFENDYCEFTDAYVLLPSEGGLVPYQTTGNPSAGRGSCGGGGGQTVGVLELEEPAAVRFEIVERSYDTLIHLRTACDDIETEIGCNDDFNGLASGLVFDRLEAGTYFLFLDGYNAREGTGAVQVTVEPPVAFLCDNGLDDDNDGRIDLEDPGCADIEDDDEGDEPACQNNFDDDNDGRIDLDDPGCADADDQNEGDEPACQNNLDDDFDGAIDLEDIGCFDENDEDESDDPEGPACDNDFDDDRDGLPDLLDSGCEWPGDDDETDPVDVVPACSNGVDDDGDGRIDWPIDPGCTGSGDRREAEQCIDGDAPLVRPGGAPVLGLTIEDGADRFRATCGGFEAPDAAFLYILDAPATLVASIDDPGTEFEGVVSIRRACDDPRTEMACAPLTARVEDARPGSYYIIVDGGGREEVIGSADPIELPPDPRGFQASDDIGINGWSDGGNDAFDGYGRLTLSPPDLGDQPIDVSLGEREQAIGDFRYTIRSELVGNVWRVVLGHPAGEVNEVPFDFRLNGNLGSDGRTVSEQFFAEIGGSPLEALFTTDGTPSDPPVVTMVVPGQRQAFANVQYSRVGDNVTIELPQALLPLTVYVALSYAEETQAVVDALAGDLLVSGGDGNVGEFVLTITEE